MLTQTIDDYTHLIQNQVRCERCKNYLVICGHDKPFSERIKTQHIDKASLKVSR